LNHLKNEKSPYLLQHADNPVDWYPWGEDAFRAARELNRPIFLSVGYSTCHWCHVMEQESFEDPQVARLMNDTFVNIKVDREERPDIDELYMTAAQLLTGRGGWPLTVVLNQERLPFFAATYIPRDSRYGYPGMLELIPRIDEVWANRRGEVDASGQSLAQALQQIAGSRKGGVLLDGAVLERAYRALSERFDEQHGGFGFSPKFPSVQNLLFLLRYWKRSGEDRALAMVEKTLTEMRRGGIYDQVGYGFHRYSTDARWQLPHFEKMLYDQALLALAYTEAFQATGRERYARTVREILAYLRRDLGTPEGAFASAEDADSEGEEGGYYTWTYSELASLLTPEQLSELERVSAVRAEGNVREEATGEPSGRNLLYLPPPERGASGSREPGTEPEPEQQPDGLPEQVRDRLFQARQRRVRPLRDDKVLADWNGLAIAALAKAGGVLAEPQYIESAEAAAGFILRTLRRPDGRLLHRYRDGEAAIPAYAADYAFLIWGLLELYESTFECGYLRQALELMDLFIEDFWDDSGGGGGFYLTASGAEKLPVRRRSEADGALPAAGSVALLDLLRLGALTGNRDYEQKALSLARSGSAAVEANPLVFTFLLTGLDFLIGPSFEVVVAGPAAAGDTRRMVRAARREFAPNRVLLFLPTEQQEPEITALAPFSRSLKSLDGKATAYVCRDRSCELPTTDVEQMLRLLRGGR
jgi:uncharacterized protein YyaL (SSP411 family)